MKSFSLNGEWLYTVGGVTSPVTVPFSRLPVGHSECRLSFDLPYPARHVFLKFDGITYHGRVTLGGVTLGEMLPYCEYTFDISNLVKPFNNELLVELEDISPAFGPTEGWENFGGIIRGVSLLLTDTPYIDNVFFKSTLTDNYTSADISVDTAASVGENVSFEISLLEGDTSVLTYTQQAGETLTKKLTCIKLWSPDSPFLYTLRVRLLSGNAELDVYECSVGFRELSCDRHRFVLNGTPLFLKGLCKHEMVADSGHGPTYEQIESDLRLIKSMGCNFVRLVHYPHCKETLNIADRLGLLVSEEPGLWWSDTSNPEVAEGSLEVLKRTILRDRNHPSVAFWLCFNECRFTEKFLIDSAALCRRYDPTRLVSGANCMNNEDTLIYYNKCGFDFYTMHPYAPTPDRALRSAKVLHDKPLLFSEWGGYFVYDNPHLLTDFMTEMNKLYMQCSDEGALAGAFFWFFAELNDFNRGEPACTDGVLHEGLVTSDRQPTAIFDAFCQGLSMFDGETKEIPFFMENASGAPELSTAHAVNVSGGGDFEEYFRRIAEKEAAKNCMRPRILKKGPVLDSAEGLLSVPKVATLEMPVVLGDIGTDKLTLIGLTTLEGGYPLCKGAYGETLAEMRITYADGSRETRPLRNGIEITTAFGLNGSSRIDPVAEKSQRYAVFGYDKNFEVYVINSMEVSTDRAIDSIEIAATGETAVLIYGGFTLS